MVVVLLAGLAVNTVLTSKRIESIKEDLHYSNLVTEVQFDYVFYGLNYLYAKEYAVQNVAKYRKSSVVTVYIEYDQINPLTGENFRCCASGVVIDPNGIILTAAHVVDDVTPGPYNRFWVVFADGVEREVLYTSNAGSRNPDVGIIWIDPDGLNLEPVEIKHPQNATQVGDTIVVVGMPFNLTFTVTSGIVSRLNVDVADPIGAVQKYIQIDAPTNPGNSGGPVFDSNGDLIGIVSWLYRGTNGLSFIVPIDRIALGIAKCSEKQER